MFNSGMKFSLPVKILFRGLLGLVIFIIFLGIANFLESYISYSSYHSFVNILNQALWTIVLLSLLFLAADLFRAFKFPYNLPYPIINAFAFVYLISFLFDLFPLIIIVSGVEIPWKLSAVRAFTTLLVFFLTIFSGYIHVFTHRHEQEKVKEEKEEKEDTEKSEEKKKPGKKKK